MAYGKGTSATKNKVVGDDHLDALIAKCFWKSKKIYFSFPNALSHDSEKKYSNIKDYAKSFVAFNSDQISTFLEWVAWSIYRTVIVCYTVFQNVI